MTHFTLTDFDTHEKHDGEVIADGQTLIIRVDGHGDFHSPNGQGELIYLEHYDGKLILRVWADINQEDPTHTIDLSGALETARIPQ
jgi:hypothetical protein